jgi:predicted small metal-binding protein
VGGAISPAPESAIFGRKATRSRRHGEEGTAYSEYRLRPARKIELPPAFEVSQPSVTNGTKHFYWTGTTLLTVLKPLTPDCYRASVRRPPMKTMTCRELGGTCDQRLSANSWDEMVQKMTKHVVDKHPDVAKDMEKMHNEDPKKWGREMKPKFDAVQEHQSATN